MAETRLVGEEARKSHQRRLESGFIDSYLSGPNILDIGYRGYIADVVPIVPQAIGVELDYPGYDGRTLPFADGSQDAVFASHCLEHIPDFAQSLRDWFRVLRVGGFLVVMVPHQFLYEKRIALPSRFNADHQRFYTPASLMADIEAVLPPNSYRLRHLADNDRHFDYTIPPERHSGGCYEIELVIEKIAVPDWVLETDTATPVQDRDTRPPPDDADMPDLMRERGGPPQVRILQAEPWDLALYDFAACKPARRRILAMQLGHFGDFIIGLPALRQLRAAFPNDFIRLVVGNWNRDMAEQSGLADEVVTHDHFPQVARGWDGKPVQGAEAFRKAAHGCFDIAIDLRVDEDTRHLLEQVNAGCRCGIGAPASFPFLDIVLPLDRRLRGLERDDRGPNLLIGPERFHSRMPVRTLFRHETDFRVTNQHVIYGPYMALPAGRFRATFGLHLTGLPLGLRRVRIRLDVARGSAVTLAEQSFTADYLAGKRHGEIPLEFTNTDELGTCEFRVHLTGRPLRARLAFSGVRLDRLEWQGAARFRPADLHIGEQISLLVQLVAERTRALYPDAPAETDARPKAGPGRARVVIAPVSNSDLRDWPVAHYVELVKLLVAQSACDVVLIGSRAQSGTLAHITQGSGVGDRITNLAGRTTWADLPAILQSADLVICNNSGIAHLAASVGARTLAIYSASHQPQEWGPRGQHSRALMAVLPCSPCGHDRLADCPYEHACMRDLRPEAVFAQAADWLNNL